MRHAIAQVPPLRLQVSSIFINLPCAGNVNQDSTSQLPIASAAHTCCRNSHVLPSSPMPSCAVMQAFKSTDKKRQGTIPVRALKDILETIQKQPLSNQQFYLITAGVVLMCS